MISGKHILLITAVAASVIILITLSPREKPGIEDTELSAVAQITPAVQIHETQETATPPLAEQRPPSLEEVTQVVRDRNNEGVQRMKVFESEGWEAVKVDDPPDADVMTLSLKLLGHREEDLQAQIQSNSFTNDMFERLTEIALTTTDDKTRYVALEALGRSGERSAQLQLTQAFEQIQDEATRAQILGYLTPAEPNDEIAVFLAEQIADPKVSDGLKKQAAFPLAMVSLLATSSPEEAIERVSMDMPDEWKDNFSSIVNLLAAGGL